MSFDLTYNYINEDNYDFDVGKIQLIGGVAKLLPTVSAPDVLLYVKLDENKGLVAIDCSGNGNHGAFQGGYTENQWTTGKINTGIIGLSTTNGFINFDQLIEFERNEAFSLECWVLTTSSASMALISKQLDANPFTGFAINMLSGKPRMVIRDSSGNVISKEHNVTINDGNWHHVVFTYDGSSLTAGCKLYVDNVQNNSIVVSGTLVSTIKCIADLQVSGREGNNLCIDSTTKLDEVLVYDREINAAEIDFRWNSGNGTQDVPGGTTSFPTDNPTIKSSNSFFMSNISGFSESVTKAGSDDIRYTIIVNGIDKWWNGSAWVDSSGYLESNTAAEINTNAQSLLTDLQPVTYKAYIHSNDGTTTPEITSASISFDSEGQSASSPSECLVTGIVVNNQGNFVQNTIIGAQLTRVSKYNNESIITRNLFTTISDENGAWSMSLVENENMESGVGYTFSFLGDGIKKSFNKIVPNEISTRFELLQDL